MPLIDKTYFVGDLNIPNTGNQAVGERVDFFIAKYEADLLMSILGYDLYKAFKAGIEAPEPELKWKDLRDGTEYTVESNGRKRKWAGLIKSTTVGQLTVKQSLIADYVYYWWMRDNASITTGIGEGKEKTEHTISISPAKKMCRAWNEMALWIEELILFLDNNTSTYPEWSNADICEIRRDFRPINEFNL